MGVTTRTEPAPGVVQCKRAGCKEPAMVYERYEGCCSLYCRDLGELEVEIERLRKFRSKVIDHLSHAYVEVVNGAEWRLLTPTDWRGLRAAIEAGED